MKALEERIEELVTAYRSATDRSTELAGKVAELESEIKKLEAKLEGSKDAGARVTELERQRDELATRLEKVLGLIDGVLGSEMPSS